MAGVMNLTFLVYFFLPWSAPSIASLRKASTLQPGGRFSKPPPCTCTCDHPALPDSEAIKSKREWGGAVPPVRATFISAGRPFGASFLAGRVTGSPGRVAYCTVAVAVGWLTPTRTRLQLSVAGKFEKQIKMRAPGVTVRWLHSSSRTPIWATVEVSQC